MTLTPEQLDAVLELLRWWVLRDPMDCTMDDRNVVIEVINSLAACKAAALNKQSTTAITPRDYERMIY